MAFIIVYGDGSPEKPYRISTCAQLHSYLDDVPGKTLIYENFLITNNLDCTGYTFNNTVSLIQSTIDGGNHRIKNINIGEYGFVYILDGSTIKNLWFESGNNDDAPYFNGGSFAQQMVNGSELNNVRSSLTLKCDGLCGGLVGTAQDSTITNSIYDGTLTAGSYSGGLVGSNLFSGTTNLTITKSAFLGTMSSPSYAGGIIGSHATNVQIIDSYTNGSFNFGPYSGGMIGAFNDTIAITKSYTNGTGLIDVSGGGIIGGFNSNVFAVNSYTVFNSYNNTFSIGNVEGAGNSNVFYSEVRYLDESGTGRCKASSNSTVSGCTSMTLSNADTISTYLGWDLTNTWQQDVGRQPTLRLTDFSDPAGIPNNGDMNDDGIKDTFQGTVKLIKNNSGQWMAIEAKDMNNCTVGDASLLNTTGIPAYSGYDFSTDFIGFNVYCPDNGQSFTTNVYLDRSIDISSAQLLFYNPVTKTYTKMTGATFIRKTIGGQTFTVISYTLTDGGLYDRDGTSDGKIEDPIVLVLPKPTTNTTSGGTSSTKTRYTNSNWTKSVDAESTENTETTATTSAVLNKSNTSIASIAANNESTNSTQSKSAKSSVVLYSLAGLTIAALLTLVLKKRKQ